MLTIINGSVTNLVINVQIVKPHCLSLNANEVSILETYTPNEDFYKEFTYL